MIEAKQLFYPVNLQHAETSRIKALLTGDGGVNPQPFACPSCGYVSFFLQPEQIAALKAR
ncbi:hypothetical protein ABT392_21860 [Paucibacter sp. JuS9]|uniref:hypothetical protein n=1 Tax=Paucibacter sp. JuS9 TaxID=3228748 RepID=UPI0037570DE5